jgi:hypothetical protein
MAAELHPAYMPHAYVRILRRHEWIWHRSSACRTWLVLLSLHQPPCYQASAQVLVNGALALAAVVIGLRSSPVATLAQVVVVLPSWTAIAFSDRRWVRVGVGAGFR